MPFTPPTAPSPVVERGRLLEVRDQAAQKRLTVIVAPPGYGKTVLLSQWAASLADGSEPQRRGRVRWLAVEADHNDGRRLAADLWAALAPATRASEGFPYLQDVDTRGLAHALVTGLNKLDRVAPTTLVLDDFHLLTQPVPLDACATLIEGAPAWLHVVVGTRAEPPLPSHRLRLDDALVELRDGDLAFTTGEAAELVRLVAGRDVGAALIEELVDLTEGWPLGLDLAARSLQDAGDDRAVLHTFAANSDLGRYFSRTVMRGRPEPERRFLLTSSVLDRMSGPLCDAVAVDQHSEAMLEDLERRSVFIVRLSPERDWFRFRRLFRGALREQLRREDPALERELLRRAADWHLARRDLGAGVHYLAEAGAWDELVRTVFAHSAAMLVQQRGAELAGWIQRLPPDVRTGRVDLVLLEALAKILSGSTSEVARALDAVDHTPSVTPAERVVADLVRSYAAVLTGSSEEAATAADRVLTEIGMLDQAALPEWLGLVGTATDVRAAGLIARGVSHLYEGDLEDATHDLEAVPPGAYGAWRVAALGSLAQVEATRGRLTAAAELCHHALAIAEEIHVTGPPVVAALLASAAVAGERDDLDRAAELLTEAEHTFGEGRGRVPMRWIATERAELALANGDTTAAVAILADQRAQDHPVMPPLVRARTAAVTARVLVMVGDLQGAQSVLDRVRAWETSDVIAARMRLVVERGDLTSARALILRWPDEPEPRARLERGLWSAILDQLEGDEAKALTGLAAVIAEAEVEGAVGLFRDTGPYALGPARALYREAPTAFLRGIVDRPATVSRPKPLRDLVVPLTDREYVVLSLLPTRLSNVEIAERLGVSLNTVKTHLKHIYRKFDAVRRSDAISAAERLHLL